MVDGAGGTWHLSRGSLEAMQVWEGRRLRRMMHLEKRMPDELRQKHMKRAAAKLRVLMNRARVKRIHERVLERVHAFAGKILQEFDDAGRPSPGSMLAGYRSRGWFRRVVCGGIWNNPREKKKPTNCPSSYDRLKLFQNPEIKEISS